MRESVDERRSILRRIAPLLIRPDLVIPLLERYGIMGTSEIYGLAGEMAEALSNSDVFIKTCVRSSSSGYFTRSQLVRALDNWRMVTGRTTKTDFTILLLNEKCGKEEGRGVWNEFILLQEQEWKIPRPWPPLNITQFCTGSSVMGIDEARPVLAKIVRNGLRKSRNWLPRSEPITPTDDTENGTLKVIPTIKTPHDILGTQQHIGRIVARAMKRLECYETSVPNLFVINLMVVHNVPKESALDDLRIIGSDRSCVNIAEIDRVTKKAGRNGNSRKVGNSMVISEITFYGCSLEEAFNTVRSHGLVTDSLPSLFRVLRRYKRTSHNPKRSRAGDKSCV
jgi:hypothetical protein